MAARSGTSAVPTATTSSPSAATQYYAVPMQYYAMQLPQQQQQQMAVYPAGMVMPSYPYGMPFMPAMAPVAPLPMPVPMPMPQPPQQPPQVQRQPPAMVEMAAPAHDALPPLITKHLDAASSASTTAEAPGQIVFLLNGVKQTVTNPNPKMLLNSYIRSKPGLTGTKHTCGEGGCGVCTVMLSYIDSAGKQVDRAVNSCLRPLCSVDGMSVTTIEGVGNRQQGYHPLQEKLAACNGSQCGFCSPGQVMSMYSLLQNNAAPEQKLVEDHLSGNLCRCTGYRPILDAFQSFASDYDPSSRACKKPEPLRDIEDLCCASAKRPETQAFVREQRQAKHLLALEHRTAAAADSSTTMWFHPLSITALLQLIVKYQSSWRKLVVGNTSIGIYKNDHPSVFIDVKDIPDLLVSNVESSGVRFGAAMAITDLVIFLENTIKSQPSRTTTWSAIVKHMMQMANYQVRNVACWAGNLMLVHQHADFQSDMMTIMMGAGVQLTLIDAVSGVTTVVDTTTFLSTDMTTKVIVNGFLPFSQSQEQLKSFRVAMRHQNAHAYVTASFRLQVDSSLKVYGTPSIVYGGVAARAVHASKTESLLVGKSLNQLSTLQQACQSLLSELVVDSAPGYVTYRTSLITAFFYRFYLTLLPNLPPNIALAAQQYDRPISTGSYSYDDNPLEYPVSKALPKVDSILQTSGEAKYTDDLPVVPGSVYGSYVTSTQAYADIDSIDASSALAMPGVLGIVTAADIAGVNNCETLPVPPSLHEEVFASKTVFWYGQVIAMVVAESWLQARDAAAAVIVKYKNVRKPLLTIDDAIAAKSFYPPPYVPAGPYTVGNVQTAFDRADVVFTGTINTGSQYHFHLESQATIVEPNEGGYLTVHTSCQWPSMTQAKIAEVLSVPANMVNVQMMRAGGSYGSKITRNIPNACAAAVAAQKFNRPVRAVMNLNQNMNLVGKRHLFQCRYKVGVSFSGKITAVELQYYDNGGWTVDASIGTMDMALNTADNTYFFPNYSVTGYACRTNLPTNTSCRAPGCLPSLFFIEHIMDHAADVIAMDPTTLRQANFYTQGQITPYGTPLVYWEIPTIWSQLQATSDFQARLKSVTQFNKQNRWTKKGISLVPLKYGIEEAGAYYSALVNIYQDGTVQISHGGCETGQGINTKVIQAAAYTLDLPMESFVVTTTNTEKSPNNGATGGSITSEMCCQAVMNACTALKERLAPVYRALPSKPKPVWKEVVAMAAKMGINLQVSASHLGPTVPQGPFLYNSYGACVTEVLVNVLSGEVEILRSDMLFDCGVSLNPLIDIGQAEGGFVMGIGYFLTEKLEWNANGQLTTDGTWEYKPPFSKDIPIDFRIALLKNAPNPNGVLSSKASGEPPMCMSSSVFLAVHQAIQAARADAGLPGFYIIDLPATPDNIQQACGVSYTQFSI